MGITTSQLMQIKNKKWLGVVEEKHANKSSRDGGFAQYL